MQFTPPPDLLPLLQQLTALAKQRGIRAFVVGGSVRDVLLARPMHDLDIAVDRDAFAFARVAATHLDGDFFELDDDHVVGRIKLRTPSVVRHIDVAQLQGTLEQDLQRRDFTIDALAISLDGGAIIDVCGGIADLNAGVVRMTGAHVFDADSLRLLRGPRIAAELGFALDPETEVAISAHALDLRTSAGERQRDELARLFELEDAYGAMRLLDRVGLLDALLPELTAGRGIEQPSEHAYDVFEHGMHALAAMDVMLSEQRPREHGWMRDTLWQLFEWYPLRRYLREEFAEGRSRASILRLAALLHDIAKPQTKTLDPNGRTHFFGHADMGADIAARVMRRLRFSTREVRFVSLLVAAHLRPGQLAAIGEAPTRRALYRFFRDLGDAAPALLLLALADAASARGSRMTSEGWAGLVGYMNNLLVRSHEEEGIVNAPRLLTGHDIMSSFNVPEGRRVGMILEALREAQGAGEVADRDEAIAFVDHIVRDGNSDSAETIEIAPADDRLARDAGDSTEL